MIIRGIDRQSSDYLKGIAMLAIMLHNYFHILQNTPGENEFTFSAQNTINLLQNLITTPHDFIGQFFSYFGHYAVQFFVFISGYGLTLSYYNSNSTKYGSFVLKRLNRLYPTFLLAVFFLFLYKLTVDVLDIHEIDLATYVRHAMFKLTLLANLIPGEALSITGPWWFFSLIFQLYLIAPFLIRLKSYRHLLGIMIVSWATQLTILYFAPQHIDYIRYNFLGHLPEFCLGIYFAKQREIKISKSMLLLAFAIFAAGTVYQLLWLFSFSTVPIFFLAVSKASASIKETNLGRPLIFIGKNSLYLFAIHGAIRAPFVALGNESVFASLAGAVLYLLVVTALAIAFKYVVERLTLSLLRQKVVP